VSLSSPCHIFVTLERRASRSSSNLDSRRTLTKVGDFEARAVEAVPSSDLMDEVEVVVRKSVSTTLPCASKEDRISEVELL